MTIIPYKNILSVMVELSKDESVEDVWCDLTNKSCLYGSIPIIRQMGSSRLLDDEHKRRHYLSNYIVHSSGYTVQKSGIHIEGQAPWLNMSRIIF